MRMKLNIKYILSRGQIFVGMSIGMLLGFTPQFWAPWPKDSGIFYLQSIGFGLLLAAYTLFTGYVFQGILAKSKSITKQDIYIFWACLPFVIICFFIFTWFQSANKLLYISYVSFGAVMTVAMAASKELPDEVVFDTQNSHELKNILKRSERIF